MKAIEFTTYGPPDVALRLVEKERPVPKDNEVLVRVHAASVNAMEWRPFTFPLLFLRLIAMGWRAPMVKELGADVAGRVEAVGAGVTRFAPGDEVFGLATGSYADYACAREDRLVLKPRAVSFEAAAAVPVAALTALQALRDRGGLPRGHKVLIYGAGGGLGTFAVQIATAFGAQVTAVCGPRNVDLMRSLGADRVIDYTREDFAAGRHRYDLILAANGRQPLRRYRAALTDTGTCVIVGGAMRQLLTALPFQLLLSRFMRRKIHVWLARPRQQDLLVLRDLLDTGKVVPVIDRRYSLEQVPEAIGYLMKGHASGKVVVTVQEQPMTV